MAVYAQPAERVAGWPKTSNGQIGLADLIGKIEATILIGLSTVSGAFSETIVREMARKVERPIIIPLSNPTIKSEAKLGFVTEVEFDRIVDPGKMVRPYVGK